MVCFLSSFIFHFFRFIFSIAYVSELYRHHEEKYSESGWEDEKENTQKKCIRRKLERKREGMKRKENVIDFLNVIFPHTISRAFSDVYMHMIVCM
jgi:hypothetical protein